MNKQIYYKVDAKVFPISDSEIKILSTKLNELRDKKLHTKFDWIEMLKIIKRLNNDPYRL